MTYAEDLLPVGANRDEVHDFQLALDAARLAVVKRIKDDDILREREDHEHMIRESDRIRAERAKQ